MQGEPWGGLAAEAGSGQRRGALTVATGVAPSREVDGRHAPQQRGRQPHAAAAAADGAVVVVVIVVVVRAAEDGKSERGRESQPPHNEWVRNQTERLSTLCEGHASDNAMIYKADIS